MATPRGLELPPGQPESGKPPLDVMQLFDRLEQADSDRLAAIIDEESVELISPEKARQYVEELRRLKELRQIREQKRRELAAADTPQAQAGLRWRSGGLTPN